jgi:hypothetical protein
MPLVAAKCTQCGSSIQVDNTKEAGVCLHCQTAFITEKAVNNYNNYIQNTTNVSMQGANIATLNVQMGANVESLLKKAYVELEHENFAAATKTCDKISDLDIQNPNLWLCRLLIEAEMRNLDELENDLALDLTNSLNYQKVIKLAPPAQKEQIQKAVEQAKQSFIRKQHEKYIAENFEINNGVLVKHIVGLKSVGDVIVPNVITSLGDWSFTAGKGYASVDNEFLKSVKLPEGLTHIGNGAFYKCKKLTNVAMPSTLKAVGDKTFYLCWSLTSMQLPNGLTHIGNMAFAFGKIKELTIPDSVVSVGVEAFYYWNKKQTINVNKQNSKKWKKWKKGCKAKIVYR